MLYYKNHSLKNENSFKMGTIAKEVWYPENIEELKKWLSTNKRFFIIGGGSNVVLDDKLEKVLSLKKMKQDFFEFGDMFFFSSSVSLQKVYRICKDRGIGGLEWAYGIPGQLGGAIVMNAGSGGVDISSVVFSVITLNRNGNEFIYSNKDCFFKRRTSIFQENNELVIGCYLRFDKKFDKTAEDKYKKSRRDITRLPSAGGVFKNWHALRGYEHQLIGLSEGNLRVSSKVNIIEALGPFQLNDFKCLISKIKKIVPEKLELEVKILEDI